MSWRRIFSLLAELPSVAAAIAVTHLLGMNNVILQGVAAVPLVYVIRYGCIYSAATRGDPVAEQIRKAVGR